MWYGLRRGPRSGSALTPGRLWASSSAGLRPAVPPSTPSGLPNSTGEQRFVPGFRTILRGFRQAVSYPSRDLQKVVAALDKVGQPLAHFGKVFRILGRQRG